METQELELQSALKLFETSKAQRKEFVDSIIEKLDEGEIDPLQVHLQVKGMEDILNQLTSTDPEKNKNVDAAKRYKEILMDAFANNCNNQKSFSYHNANFRRQETGSKYHFEKTEDPLIMELYKERELLNAKIKEREEFLKGVPTSGQSIITADGEALTVYPPYRTSTTSIIVTLK